MNTALSKISHLVVKYYFGSNNEIRSRKVDFVSTRFFEGVINPYMHLYGFQESKSTQGTMLPLYYINYPEVRNYVEGMHDLDKIPSPSIISGRMNALCVSQLNLAPGDSNLNSVVTGILDRDNNSGFLIHTLDPKDFEVEIYEGNRLLDTVDCSWEVPTLSPEGIDQFNYLIRGLIIAIDHNLPGIDISTPLYSKLLAHPAKWVVSKGGQLNKRLLPINYLKEVESRKIHVEESTIPGDTKKSLRIQGRLVGSSDDTIDLTSELIDDMELELTDTLKINNKTITNGNYF